jgi:hypothetical protein
VAQGLWSEPGAKDTAHNFSDITTLEGTTGFWLGGRAAGNTADNGNDAMLVHIDSGKLLLSHHSDGTGPVDSGGIAMARLGDGVGISAYLYTVLQGISAPRSSERTSRATSASERFLLGGDGVGGEGRRDR